MPASLQRVLLSVLVRTAGHLRTESGTTAVVWSGEPLPTSATEPRPDSTASNVGTQNSSTTHFGKSCDDPQTNAASTTFIMASNWRECGPNVKLFEKVTRSYEDNMKGFDQMPKLFLYDGYKGPEKEHANFETLLHNVSNLLKSNNKFYSRARLVAMPQKVGLTKMLIEALKEVTTPFVFIAQDDFSVTNVSIDADSVARAMMAHPEMKYVRLGYYKIKDVPHRLAGFAKWVNQLVSAGFPNSTMGATINRCGANFYKQPWFSDNNHFALTLWLRDFLDRVDRKGHEFPEDGQKDQLELGERDQLYALGTFDDEPRLLHNNGHRHEWC